MRITQRKGKQFCLLEISHMLTNTQTTTTTDGTLGEDLLKEAQLISPGFGPLETMNSILPPSL